jgi:hypothetical protein
MRLLNLSEIVELSRVAKKTKKLCYCKEFFVVRPVFQVTYTIKYFTDAFYSPLFVNIFVDVFNFYLMWKFFNFYLLERGTVECKTLVTFRKCLCKFIAHF